MYPAFYLQALSEDSHHQMLQAFTYADHSLLILSHTAGSWSNEATLIIDQFRSLAASWADKPMPKDAYLHALQTLHERLATAPTKDYACSTLLIHFAIDSTIMSFGLYGISIIRNGEIIYQTHWGTLGELLDTDYDQSQAMYANVYTGPLLGYGNLIQPEICPPLELGDCMIISHRTVLQALALLPYSNLIRFHTASDPITRLRDEIAHRHISGFMCAAVRWERPSNAYWTNPEISTR